jgi:signal transduction histidine kinase
MIAAEDQDRNRIRADYLNIVYKRHVQGAFVRSIASFFMWCSSWIAYAFGIIGLDNFTGVSLGVLFLIVFNLPTLWILKRITHKKLLESFSLLINLLEIIGYTAVMHFLGGIEALYLLPVYGAVILYVGMVAPRKLPFIVAAFCIVCFSAMVTFEHFGMLRSYKLHPTFQWPWPNQVLILLANATMLLVFAFISSYTALLLKRNRERLHRQNEDLRVALVRANEADRLKSEFLANMSHELRTPLNAIIGFSELMEYQNPESLDEHQKEFVRNINTSGQHLLSIISDILDLSKLEAGKLRMEPTDVPLPALLEDCRAIFREESRKRKVQLLSDITECPEKMRADELRLKQIVYNLLSNAVKFTPDGGTVILSARHLTRQDRGWSPNDREAGALPVPGILEPINGTPVVDIAVSDTGIGIKQEDRERIFKPFEQGDGSMTRQYPGTGLGLSLSKRLVELHGGYMYVDSAGENKGSTFHCIFPA